MTIEKIMDQYWHFDKLSVEMPVFKSIARHYHKRMGMDRKGAVYYAIARHGKQINEWYERMRR